MYACILEIENPFKVAFVSFFPISIKMNMTCINKIKRITMNFVPLTKKLCFLFYL